VYISRVPDAGPLPHEPTETVERPDPGSLARGVWEAPAWAFYAGVAVVLLAAVLYAAAHAGLLRRKKRP
jgi:hypothetical protein